MESKMKKYDLGIVGNICSVDIATAIALKERGLKVVVLALNDNRKAKTQTLPHHAQKNAIETINSRNRFDFVKNILKCRMILSFTGDVLFKLAYLYPLKFMPAFPQIANVATGADLTELLDMNSLLGRLYRFHLKTSPFNWIVEYPHALKNIIKHNIPNCYPMKFPGFFINMDMHPMDTSAPYIKLFHPARLDWGANNNKNRFSTKGTDRFLRAFIKAVKNGLNAKCTILRRGPDLNIAEQMIRKSGVESAFIWKDEMDRDNIINEITKSHLLVDQFDYGGIGCTSIEAMMVGRPVMIYSNRNCSRLLFGTDIPPVLNCYSEDEIYTCLMQKTDLNHLKKVGTDCYNWVDRNFADNSSLDTFLFHFSRITGYTILDYGY